VVGLCIVGESGCGKTLCAKSIMGLIDRSMFTVEGGSILFDGKDVLKMDSRALARIRGKEMAMIFQEPMTALNPVFTIGDQINEMLEEHLGLSGKGARKHIVELLQRVGMPDPARKVHAYPHELSGGMRQRAMIAMALSCNPSLLIADEPTTALDVTVQAQILSLLKRLREENQMALIFVTHDLGIVSLVAERVIIMYAGFIVEESPVEELFTSCLHPYTKGLLRSIPYGAGEDEDGGRLESIPGTVPSMEDLPPGCPFHPRCAYQISPCTTLLPELLEVGGKRRVRCHLYTQKTSKKH